MDEITPVRFCRIIDVIHHKKRQRALIMKTILIGAGLVCAIVYGMHTLAP